MYGEGMRRGEMEGEDGEVEVSCQFDHNTFGGYCGRQGLGNVWRNELHLCQMEDASENIPNDQRSRCR